MNHNLNLTQMNTTKSYQIKIRAAIILIDLLEELRKMIKLTKLTIEDYANEVYDLKNTVIKANFSFRDAGKGINENVFWEMSC